MEILIPVLRHHRFNIGQEFSGLGVDDVPKIKKIIAIRVERLSKLRTKTGEVVYPGLQNKNGKEAYKQQYLTMVLAFMMGKIIVIPDIGNFDPLCELCGNQQNGQCVKPHDL